ncbi:DUF2637 domain-containing protein [Kutzneria sp. CA-103260]|uniref:DUF2637 domain-containing protein n=1 Tax=Kutzneria sp. CA-103260 TaxID=2802641 RepID=UPI001BACE2E2|nr:DUF2637 domain-containing protein [Kutzneria sp. CA-103260]QUQ70434.1 hypothetical protein JJ691_82130 [Kutzneria sp. CA-103260]
MSTQKLSNGIRLLVAAVLGLIGAAAGFTHTHNWAAHHGQTGWLAWADAVVIEGMALVAAFEIHRDRQTSRAGRVSLPVVVLVAGFLVQMAAQVAEAEPTPAGWLLAAMPALGFLTVVKLLMRRLPHKPPATPPTPAATEPEPAAPVRQASATRLRLPAPMVEKITGAVRAAQADGREPTIADVQLAANVSDDMAAQILTDLTIHNGHSVQR